MAAPPFHELSEAMDCEDSPLYPTRGARDSKPSVVFGRGDPYQIESSWVTQGHGTQFRGISDGYPRQSTEAAVPFSMLVYEAQCEPNTGPSQQPQQPTTLSNCLDESFSTGPKPEPFNAAAQRPSRGGYDGSKDYDIIRSYPDNTHHDVLHDIGPTHDMMVDPEMGDFLVPRTTTVQDMSQDTKREPQRAEESVGGAPQEVHQGTIGSSFQALSQGAGEHPLPPRGHSPTSRYPTDPTYILKFLERSDGGRATCLWASEGYACGFFSQVDLVKRHIKRMHYRLR